MRDASLIRSELLLFLTVFFLFHRLFLLHDPYPFGVLNLHYLIILFSFVLQEKEYT